MPATRWMPRSWRRLKPFYLVGVHSRLLTPPKLGGVELRLSEVLGALSHALDITSGQPTGHAERTCLIAMRLAEQLELDEPTRRALFYASLVKDAGCSSTGARVAALYDADDTHVKTDRRRTDFVNTPEA